MIFFKRNKIAHLCVLNRNIGDNALNLVIDDRLKENYSIKYINVLNNFFNDKNVEKLQGYKLIVFGGGGLLHSYGPKGNRIERTGTHWHIKLIDLKKLQPKIILFGIGFNHFYNEDGPLPVVRDFFEILIEKDSIISFRNDGSKERFLKYYPEFENYIEEIPDPGVFFRIKQNKPSEPYVVLQVASDRKHLRYGNHINELLEYLKILCSKIDYRILAVPHTPDDVKFNEFLKQHLDIELVPLKNKVKDTKKVVALYSGSQFTISTRGHSQILSVGNNVPTYSIITHPKVEGFAKSCGLMDYTFNFTKNHNDFKNDSFDKFLKDINKIDNKLHILNNNFDQQFHNFIDKIFKLTEK